jgi:hypothetical protein
MHQLQLFKVLITPSPLSAVLIFILAITWVLVNSWLYFSNNPFVYQYVFGPNGITSYAWEGTESITSWGSKFFSSPAGYYVLLAAFGLIVGAAVFALLQAGSLVTRGTTSFIQKAENATRPVVMLEIFTQLWVRCLAVIGWAWFMSVTLGSILPLLDIFIDSGASHIRSYSLTGAWYYAQAIVLAIVTLHMHTVFARLTLLRPRIFHSQNI